jgi:hypothetical protein
MACGAGGAGATAAGAIATVFSGAVAVGSVRPGAAGMEGSLGISKLGTAGREKLGWAAASIFGSTLGASIFGTVGLGRGGVRGAAAKAGASRTGGATSPLEATAAAFSSAFWRAWASSCLRRSVCCLRCS